MGIGIQSIFWGMGIFFVGYIALLSCSRTPRNNYQAELIAIALQDKPGLQNACEIFVRTENLCVVNGYNVPLICNGSLQTRLRNHIQPESRRTDDILESYFRCFDSCNKEFNIMSRCQDLPLSTNTIYRREQRRSALTDAQSNRGLASIQWNNCYDGCRSVNGKEPPVSSPLRGSGTTFPVDWFVEN